MNWEEQKKIEKILKDNIKEVPYEGTEVDTYNLKEAIYEYGKLIYNQAIDDCLANAEVREYYVDSGMGGYTEPVLIYNSLTKLKKQ